MGIEQQQGRTMEGGDGHGIKELLAAEKDAAKIVAEAKQKRMEKMKKAKEDAQREIAEYKSAREAEFNAYKAQHSSGGSASSEALASQTQAAISDLEREAGKNRAQVVDMLVGFVTTVKA